MRHIGILLFAWVVPFLTIAMPLTSIFWAFGRKRIYFGLADLSLLILPYLTWAITTLCCSTHKSLVNMVEEPSLVASSVVGVTLLRFLIGKRWKPYVLTLASVVLTCMIGVLVSLLVPFQPE